MVSKQTFVYKHMCMYFILIYSIIKTIHGFLKYLGFINNIIKNMLMNKKTLQKIGSTPLICNALLSKAIKMSYPPYLSALVNSSSIATFQGNHYSDQRKLADTSFFFTISVEWNKLLQTCSSKTLSLFLVFSSEFIWIMNFSSHGFHTKLYVTA